jgi:hypothetical protein
MEMKATGSRVGSKFVLHGRAGSTALTLLAAVALLVSGCKGAMDPVVAVTAAPQITSFKATSSSVTAGGSTTLSWVVINSSVPVAISGIGAVSGNTYPVTVASGTSVKVTPVETTTYTLTAGGAGGGALAKLTITVNGNVVATNCTTTGTIYTVGTGATVVNVASATNFTTPLLVWFNNYFFSGNNNANYATDSATYTIDLCSDTTANIESAIAANTYVPNIFFAADASVEGASYATTSMEYAQGYPILLGYTAASGKAKTITGIADLVKGLTGATADISATVAPVGTKPSQMAAYTLGTLITSGTPGSLIANPILDAYGATAVNIVDNMATTTNTITYNAAGTAVTAYPLWLKNPTTYANDAAAFSAIGASAGAPTGFASFSDICKAIPTGAVYVRFTGADALVPQAVADLELNPGGGTEIYNLIYTEMTDANSTWQTFITSDYQFGSCFAGI